MASIIPKCAYIIILILSVMGLLGCQDSAPSQNIRPTNVPATVQGWIEAAAIVRDLESQTAFFTQIAGYDIIHQGPTPPAILNAWNLPASAQGREVLLREPGEARGYVRLIELSGVPGQIEARSAGTFIDTGGVMGVNVRVRDIEKTFDKLQAASWRPLSNPVSFAVEEFSVSEVLFLGPDGLVIGLIERQKPPLGPEWRMKAGDLSRPNNAFIITSDIKAASDFYETEFGWTPVLEDKAEQAAASGMNIYGWPHTLAAKVKRHVIWFHPNNEAAAREGTIALIELDGVEGRDFSAMAAPPNYGWTSLRTWTDAQSAPPNTQSAPFHMPPYGCAALSIVRDRDGAQIERLSPSEACED